MSNTISPNDQSIPRTSSLTPLFNSKYSQTKLTRKTSSLISVSPNFLRSKTQLSRSDHDHQHRRDERKYHSNHRLYQSISEHIVTHERLCALTQMLHAYTQKAEENKSNQLLHNIFNVLELHFNTYANDQGQIYFEGIFQILHDFKEQIPEILLIETMQMLKMDPLKTMNFDQFILILWHLPKYEHDPSTFLDVFNELDQNNDLYITFDDLRMILPHLTTHFDETIIQAAIHLIDTDHDNDRLSYFDFVTSFLALEECKLMSKTKTITSDRRESKSMKI